MTLAAGQDSDGAFHPLYAAIHRSILSGFLSNIALKKEKVFFRAAKDREVMLFPGSGLFKNPGAWIVAAEMVETSRLVCPQCGGGGCGLAGAPGRRPVSAHLVRSPLGAQPRGGGGP